MTNPNDSFSEWADLIENLLSETESIGIGVFGIDQTILYANKPMAFFFDIDSDTGRANNYFINPQFTTLLRETQDLVFNGLLTIGNYSNISYFLNAKIFRKESSLLVFAEVDVKSLFENNKNLSKLNQEVNNLQRELIKEKRNLELALNQLKETQQLLIHSEKMNAMGKLVAGVAHEVNNPIAFVYSNLYSLENYSQEVFDTIKEIEAAVEKGGSNETLERVSRIKTECDLEYLKQEISDMIQESKEGVERVRSIVDDLRRFSRLDESDVKHIDLTENIKSTLSIIKSEVTRKKIDLKFEYPGQIFVDCFPGQLNQAILNVLINAVDAVEDGGIIGISAFENNDNVVIGIEDNGCGIPNEIRSRIFDPFFTTKPVGSGTGLGLSITYKIIHDLHKGDIQVESSEQGGTKFMITIPRKI